MHHFGAKGVAVLGPALDTEFMDVFRDSLRAEFLKRTAKNPRYSLRAFATSVGIHHATISGFLSGRRKVSKAAIRNVGSALNWSPQQVARCLGLNAKSTITGPQAGDYVELSADEYLLLSDWTFDAVLEYASIPGIKVEPKVVAAAFNLSELQAKLTLDSLVRLGLLKRDSKKGLRLTKKNTTTILSSTVTTTGANQSSEKPPGKIRRSSRTCAARTT